MNKGWKLSDSLQVGLPLQLAVGARKIPRYLSLQVLEAAYRKLGHQHAVKTHVMNPKAMDRKQLLGSMDLDTREWTDGVLTSAARKVVEEASSQRCVHWAVCGGSVALPLGVATRVWMGLFLAADPCNACSQLVDHLRR